MILNKVSTEDGSLGKGEVDSSILSGSTSQARFPPSQASREEGTGRPANRNIENNPMHSRTAPPAIVITRFPPA